MTYDFMFEAAEVALAASMKDFENRVAATGRDLNASAVSLSWQGLAGILFAYFCKEGINPLKLPGDELDDVLTRVADALDWTVEGERWEVAVAAVLQGSLHRLRLYTPANPDTEVGYMENQ